jgi:ABC-type iron transport system FetAB permease component
VPLSDFRWLWSGDRDHARNREPSAAYLDQAPVGSMMMANAMNACAQPIERFRAEILAHVGQIEAGLSLGADPAVAVSPPTSKARSMRAFFQGWIC